MTSNDLVFLDCEASSLRSYSYPIEIGWARLSPTGDISVDAVLIKPPPSWDDWDPEAEKVHGIPLRHLYTHGLAPELAMQRIVDALAGEIVYSDSERDKLWCRVLFNLADRGNPFRWKHADVLWSAHHVVISEVAFDVATRLVEQSGPVLHRAGADAARHAVFHAIARGIDIQFRKARTGGADRPAGFAVAEAIGKPLIERYHQLLVHPARAAAAAGMEMTSG